MNASPGHFPPRTLRGFTLIELLIVVAIIAILAAIALPNFLEAQLRAKVSRAQADMRSMATGLESYLVDYNRYPRARPIGATSNLVPLSARISGLTTPVAYLTALPPDVFPPADGWNGGGMNYVDFDTYDYFDSDSDYDEDQYATDSTRGRAWRLASIGPDNWASYGIVWGASSLGVDDHQGFDYDPTNGARSNGDVLRLGPLKRGWSYDQALSGGSGGQYNGE